MWRIDRDTLSFETFYNSHGSDCAQGLAVDAGEQVWVSRFCPTGTVGHFDGTNRRFIGNVTGVPRGSTGLAVDGAGKIWVASETDSKVARIDPNAGPIGSDGVRRVGAVDLVVNLPGARPYNYSISLAPLRGDPT